MYLKSRGDWPHVCEDLRNFNAVYDSPNLVSVFNKVITSFIDRRGSSKFVR